MGTACIQGLGVDTWGKETISFGRQLCQWENNIKLDFQEVGWCSMGWIDLAEDMDRWWALMNAVMNLRIL